MALFALLGWLYFIFAQRANDKYIKAADSRDMRLVPWCLVSPLLLQLAYAFYHFLFIWVSFASIQTQRPWLDGIVAGLRVTFQHVTISWHPLWILAPKLAIWLSLLLFLENELVAQVTTLRIRILVSKIGQYTQQIKTSTCQH